MAGWRRGDTPGLHQGSDLGRFIGTGVGRAVIGRVESHSHPFGPAVLAAPLSPTGVLAILIRLPMREPHRPHQAHQPPCGPGALHGEDSILVEAATRESRTRFTLRNGGLAAALAVQPWPSSNCT